MSIEKYTSLSALSASSAFLLCAALKMPAVDFGQALEWQALFLIFSALLTPRTFDLVFYLQNEFKHSATISYLLSLKIELGLFFLIIGIIFAWLKAMDHALLQNIESRYEIAVSIVAAAALVFQGASLARLRCQQRHRVIALSHAIAAFAYGIGVVWLWWAPRSAVEFFTTSLGLLAVRPLLLLTMGHFCKDQSANGACERHQDVPMFHNVLWFLIKGQGLNAIKNNLLHIETLTLGLLSNPEVVALFRTLKAFTNIVKVLLNIEYQKAFAKLLPTNTAKAGRWVALSKIRNDCILIWAQTIPLIAIAAAGFTIIHPDPAYNMQPIVLITAILATLPQALQQANFALLAVNGNYGAIALAYLAGLITLTVLTLLVMGTNSSITIATFFMFNFLSAVVVFIITYRQASHTLSNEEPLL